MAPRTSKNKANAEKGAITPVPNTTGRQRTMSTKQQLLCELCIVFQGLDLKTGKKPETGLDWTE